MFLIYPETEGGKKEGSGKGEASLKQIFRRQDELLDLKLLLYSYQQMSTVKHRLASTTDMLEEVKGQKMVHILFKSLNGFVYIQDKVQDL